MRRINLRGRTKPEPKRAANHSLASSYYNRRRWLVQADLHEEIRAEFLDACAYCLDATGGYELALMRDIECTAMKNGRPVIRFTRPPAKLIFKRTKERPITGGIPLVFWTPPDGTTATVRFLE